MQPDSTAAGSDEVARVQAIRDNADRLGLIWNRVPATITSSEPLLGILDNDTEPIGLVSMIGPCFIGQRVYVDNVPPSGHFVSGFVDFFGGAVYAGPVTPGTLVASTTGTEAAVPTNQWLPSGNNIQPRLQVPPNFIARVTLVIGMFLGTATPSQSIIRIRKTTPTPTTGTIYCGWREEMDLTTVKSVKLIGYVQNPGETTSDQIVAVTIQQAAGSATQSLYADTTLPMFLEVEPIGLVSLNPALAAAAVNVLT
jgi:hypothetical protein